MATNPYFTQGTTGEQDLIESIIIESLKIYGRDFLYIPRTQVSADKIFGEDRLSKFEHAYPHCWRTDKPVLYYPLDSWFIKTTACKDRLVELNKTINWKPESTGTGRFGNWLENLVDWNLSRSRYWGTPLPIWRTEDGKEEVCIGSVAELKAGIAHAEAAGIEQKWSTKNWPEKIDLHRPYVDDIILLSESGKIMRREPDLIDVWFDSGATGADSRNIQVHLPWSDSVVYFDTAGCCAGDTRISRQELDPVQWRGRWNHYVFLKDGPRKEIWRKIGRAHV